MGGSFDDVVKLTLYFVDWSAEKLPRSARGSAGPPRSSAVDLIKPVTLLSVSALGEPDLLVEVDAIAVLD